MMKISQIDLWRGCFRGDCANFVEIGLGGITYLSWMRRFQCFSPEEPSRVSTLVKGGFSLE
ncbi:unnamed protein product [Moneuplotes crassus]|uniref:Uncharacterized protein n=1 Tax=Euplotes crassus TaxID=5936 RepID=A0AAD1XVB7_EUPCR|nr:unnamed protein product [Moneuplotes crassus]